MDSLVRQFACYLPSVRRLSAGKRMTMAECHCVCHFEGEIICAACCLTVAEPAEPIAPVVVPGPPTPEQLVTDPHGTRDGKGAGDHDEPFTFDQRPTVMYPQPFTQHQMARLMIIRSRVQEDKAA